MSKLSYRPDIDGLRAIAVLSVIAFHISPDWLPGGYLGVDIFFVISGFLITTILLRDMEAAASKARGWNWRDFYERRARRILPPLLLVLAVSTGFAFWLLGGAALLDYGRSLLASLGFIANWHFLSETGYFDAPAHSKPLLHIWSLGVEEQYYLLFPLILWPIIKLSRKWAFPVIATLSVASLVMFIIAASKSPDHAFFSTHLRFWQIGCGSLLAMGLLGSAMLKREMNGALKNSLGILAVIALGLALSLWADQSSSGLPRLSPVLATIATAVLIYIGAQGQHFIGRLLGLAPMRGVGKISYALYLWHWPILVFLPILVPNPSSTLIAAGMALALILSVLSYFVIEQPIRTKRVFKSTRSVIFAIAAIILPLIFCAGFILMSPNSTQFQSSNADAYETERMRQVQQFYSESQRRKCWMDSVAQVEDSPNHCLHMSSDKPNILIIGDSHAAQYFGPMQEAFPNASFSTFAANSCSLMPEHIFPQHTACKALMKYIDTDLPLNEFDVIIMAPRLDRSEVLEDYVARVNDYRTRFEGRLIVMGPIQFYKPNPPTLYAAHMGKPADELDSIFDRAIVKDMFDMDAYLGTVFGQNDDVDYISTLEVLCPRGMTDCRHTNPEGWPILIDNSHMSPSAVRALVADLKSGGALQLP